MTHEEIGKALFRHALFILFILSATIWNTSMIIWLMWH